MRILLTLMIGLLANHVMADEISRIWLSHRTNDPSKLVFNWETNTPGSSVVHFSPGNEKWNAISVDEKVTLHHVEVPLERKNTTYRYRVQSGDSSSQQLQFKAYPTEVLRVAVVADWAGKPKLDALVADDVHLLLTAGDNIGSLHSKCGAGVVDCTKPYGELIDACPALFRSVPFLPALGNHDREIRPRGDRPPAEPVYDIQATAFRRFFDLPDDEWKWHFDVPEFGVRFIALDSSHTSDIGTTWQTCHALDKSSEQFRWYEKLMTEPHPPRVVTIQNERNATLRSKSLGFWHEMIRRGTLAVSGFGYFAERAEVDGFTYYNTALGTGAKYPDPQSKFFDSVASYILLTVTAGSPPKMTVELKSLDGKVLDRKTWD